MPTAHLVRASLAPTDPLRAGQSMIVSSRRSTSQDGTKSSSQQRPDRLPSAMLFVKCAERPSGHCTQNFDAGRAGIGDARTL